MDGCINGWAHVKSLNLDLSRIIQFLTFLDILLKPPQPFIGLFLVILLSPRGPHCPRVVPVIPTSSSHRPRHPQKVPMWSPWSVVSTCRPHRPHIVPILSPSSPRHPHVVPVIPRRSPCGLHGLWSPHVVSVVPTSSPSSPRHPRHPHII